MKPDRSVAEAWRFFLRATRLRCPICGHSPLFVPLRRVRTLSDWFMPLDGCPRCGYAYDREPGYFLLAIWAVNYGVASILGLAIYLTLELAFDLPLVTLIIAVLAPIPVFNVLFARHAKAYFLAFDHWCDPHEREGGDDQGNEPLHPAPPPRNPGDPVAPPTTAPESDLAGVR